MKRSELQPWQGKKVRLTIADEDGDEPFFVRGTLEYAGNNQWSVFPDKVEDDDEDEEELFHSSEIKSIRNDIAFPSGCAKIEEEYE